MMTTWKLDPNKTAQENLWFLIDKFTELRINCNKKLKLTQDERHELISDIRIRAYMNFMGRLRAKKYNRNYSIYQNVYGSVWSAAGRTITTFIKHNREKISALRYDDALHTEQIVHTNSLKKRPVLPERQLVTRDRDLDYEDYCGCCEEFGLVPMSHEDYMAACADL